MPKWEEQESRINRSLGQMLKATDRAIGRRFAQTLNIIRGMIGELYEKYESGGTLTLAEMVKYDRLNNFLTEIDALMGANYRDIYKTIYDALGWTYIESFDLTAWAIEVDAKVKLGYTTTATATSMEAMLKNPISGLTLKQSLQKARQSIVWTIQQEVTQGLSKGESYRTMMERLKPALDNDAAKAMRVVRTEAHRVTEGAKIDAATHADERGVRMLKTWRTSKDQRVRHTNKADHRKLEGVTLPVDEDFEQGNGKGAGPGQMHSAAHDINCRCFLQYTVDRVEKKQYDNMEMLGFDKWRQEHQ